LSGGEFVGNVPGVGQGASEPVEFGNDQTVTGAARGQGLTPAGSGSRGAGESVVDLDPIRVDAEVFHAGALDGEVLLKRRDSGVSDQQFTHQQSVPYVEP